MTTNRQITKAIKDATGIDHIRVHSAKGLCDFYSDDEGTAELLATIAPNAVYVCYINQQTATEWTDDFIFNIDSDYKRAVISGVVK